MVGGSHFESVVHEDRAFGQRLWQTTADATSVKPEPVRTAADVHILAGGTLLLEAEQCTDATGRRWVRISSPSGWVDAETLEPAAPVTRPRPDLDRFRRHHMDIAPGDHHGIPFPITVGQLAEFGPDFLTAAFRATGTIAPGNAVTKILAVEPLSAKGASTSAFLKVAYAHQEPGLQTSLFAKLPLDDFERKFEQSPLSRGEVAMGLFSREVSLPVSVPRCYFADVCTATTNAILITERIDYGSGAIEPAYSKARDHEVPDVMEHYRVLARAQARLAASHKTGALGYDIERIFPYAHAARDFRWPADVTANVDRVVDLVGRVAPQLFVAEARNPAFLARWREDVLFGLAHKDAVVAFLHRDVDYTGICHPNLNLDNAWFWRDPAGELQAGLLDWGGAGQISFAQALSGMMMVPDPDMHGGILRLILDTFVDEYHRISGLPLDRDRLLMQYKASLFSTALCSIVSVMMPILFQMPEEDFHQLTDRFDPRIQHYRSLYFAIAWLDNLMREWLDGITPGEACRMIVAQHRSADAPQAAVAQ